MTEHYYYALGGDPGALALAPPALLLGLGVPWLASRWLRRPSSEARRYRPSHLFWSKLLVLVVLVSNAAASLSLPGHRGDDAAELCLVLGHLACVVVVLIEKLCGSHTSPPQFFYWSE